MKSVHRRRILGVAGYGFVGIVSVLVEAYFFPLVQTNAGQVALFDYFMVILSGTIVVVALVNAFMILVKGRGVL